LPPLSKAMAMAGPFTEAKVALIRFPLGPNSEMGPKTEGEPLPKFAT